MLTLTQTDRMALTQLSARNTLPVTALIAVRAAYLIELWEFRHRSRKALENMPGDALADIGLTRFEAKTESAKWFWRP